MLAQDPPPTPIYVPYALDSGYVNAQPGAQATHVGDVHYPGTSSLQIWFAQPALMPGTRLRMQSMLDGAVQWFDAQSIADYQNVSAYFNGDRVRLELWPTPGTTNNRVVVSKVRIADVMSPTEGLCQATDVRTLSTDARVGRIDGCCTAFLVDERTMSSAGHCISSIAGQMVHFNVPLSDAAGNAQYPPPQDQYAMRANSLTSVNGGPGNDYSVFSTVRNSNSGRYAGEVQGWLNVALVPAGTAPQNWSVTGYGTSTVNLAWSLAQKTATGPRVSTSNSVLMYRISTSGCNSGSPIIGANGLDVHGVATHAGCSATGGNNLGTGFGLPAYMQAITGTRQQFVAGTLGVYGQGCAGASGTPQLALAGAPDLGGSVTATVTNTDPSVDAIGLLLVGLSDTAWNGTPLPIDLSVSGIPGCALRIAPSLTFALLTNFGSASRQIPIPNQPVFLGASFFMQHFAHDVTALNGAQVVSTNAAKMRVGN